MENGSKIFKTTCLKTMFNSEPLSKDRLRRIQGLTACPSKSVNTNCDKMLFVGDPIAFSEESSTSLCIGNIVKMILSNKEVKQIDTDADNLNLGSI